MGLCMRSSALMERFRSDYEHIAPNIFHSTWSSPSMGVVGGRPLIFFAGGNGVVYAFERFDGTVQIGLRAYRPEHFSLHMVIAIDGRCWRTAFDFLRGWQWGCVCVRAL